MADSDGVPQTLDQDLRNDINIMLEQVNHARASMYSLEVHSDKLGIYVSLEMPTPDWDV